MICQFLNVVLEKQVHFKAELCKKYRLYWKKLKTKALQNLISYKKLTGRTSLSPPGVELWASKDLPFLNIIFYWNGEVGSLSGDAAYLFAEQQRL